MIERNGNLHAWMKRDLVEEHDQKLQEKHGDNVSHFQYKLWTEMITSGMHSNTDKLPAASTFGRTPKQKGSQPEASNTSDAVISGMMSVMNTPCNVATNKQVCNRKFTSRWCVTTHEESSATNNIYKTVKRPWTTI